MSHPLGFEGSTKGVLALRLRACGSATSPVAPTRHILNLRPLKRPDHHAVAALRRRDIDNIHFALCAVGTSCKGIEQGIGRRCFVPVYPLHSRQERRSDLVCAKPSPFGGSLERTARLSNGRMPSYPLLCTGSTPATSHGTNPQLSRTEPDLRQRPPPPRRPRHEAPLG